MEGRGPSRRSAVALLSVTAAVSCFVLAAFVSGSSKGESVGLLSVLGINLGFFAELRVGQYAPGFPVGGDVQWLNSKVCNDVIFVLCAAKIAGVLQTYFLLF